MTYKCLINGNYYSEYPTGRTPITFLSILLPHDLNVSVFIFESSLLSIIFSLELKVFSICYSSNKKQLFSTCLSTPTGSFLKITLQCCKALVIFLKEAFLLLSFRIEIKIIA